MSTVNNTIYASFPTRDDETFVLQVISFLKKKEGFIGLVLKHIDASAMMDLLLRLISCVEPASLRQEVLLVSNLLEGIHKRLSLFFTLFLP